jgi:1,4-dihydroxy-2-naphthoate octaprenyltransferase
MAEHGELQQPSYNRFSLKAALELCSPPTWVAALMPTLVGGALAFGLGMTDGLVGGAGLVGDVGAALANTGLAGTSAGALAEALTAAPAEASAEALAEALANTALAPTSWYAIARPLGAWLLVLLTALLLQSAVNTLNDYQDFLSGTDTAATILDTSDASIVYNHINPRDALRFAIALMLTALLTGLGAVLLSSWILLLFGVLAAGIVIFYSAGPRPISFLPLGEVVSGLAMGLFITGAACFVVSLRFDPWVLAAAVPPIITIALIMQTNNTCDIERDLAAGRHTLPIRLTRPRSQRLAHVLAWGTLVWMTLLSLLLWPLGIVVSLAAAIALKRRITRIAHGPYDLVNRRVMMGNATAFCRWVNLAWTLAILSGIILKGSLT